MDNVDNPRGSAGAPNPARKPNTVRKCDATIDLDHFLQQSRGGHVHLLAAKHLRLGIHAPVHSHDPVEAFANGLENAWHSLRQRRRFHEHACGHVLRGELLFAQPQLGYVRSGSPEAFEGSIQSKHRLTADLEKAEVFVRQRHIVLEVAERLALIEIPVVRLPVWRFQALAGEFLPRLAHDRVARNWEYLEEAIGYEGEAQVFVHFVDPVACDLSYIAEALIGCLQLGLMSLDVGEIRVDDDNAVIPRFPLADLIPAPVAALYYNGLTGLAVSGNAVANPLFGIVLRGWNHPLLHRATDNTLERIADL